jgi:hypothetical protein
MEQPNLKSAKRGEGSLDILHTMGGKGEGNVPLLPAPPRGFPLTTFPPPLQSVTWVPFPFYCIQFILRRRNFCGWRGAATFSMTTLGRMTLRMTVHKFSLASLYSPWWNLAEWHSAEKYRERITLGFDGHYFVYHEDTLQNCTSQNSKLERITLS